ncbi:protein of unknown function [Kyrpidia spormannii]|uniref:Uncharacterized protein n=1 Tax=Kyrpidia spormannii TaxID=2055160 RepID=A0ACA8Z8G7_9BACL|nr:protein of unknown function [Kyrpidia spormannii]
MAHKDRLVRFGFDFLEDLFAQFGCEILVVNKAEGMSPAQELAEDLISIVQHFAAKLYGARTYRARKPQSGSGGVGRCDRRSDKRACR